MRASESSAYASVEVSLTRLASGSALLSPDCSLNRHLDSARLHQLPAWQAAAGQALFFTKDSAAVISIGGRVVGLLPWNSDSIHDRTWQARTFGAPEHKHLALSDILLLNDFRSAAFFDAALRALHVLSPWDTLCYARVPERSHLLSVVSDSSFTSALYPSGHAAYCDLSTDRGWALLSKDMLRNVDRLRRRAEREFGAVRAETIVGEASATSGFDRFLTVEDSSWKGSEGAGTSLALDSAGRAFFHRLAFSLHSSQGARVDILSIAGEDAAAQLSLRTGGVWNILKIGYNPKFRDVGPGGILLKSFLEEMRSDSEIHEVNLTTSPAWASRWHFQQEPTFAVVVYNRTVRGRAFDIRDSLRRRASGIMRFLRSARMT